MEDMDIEFVEEAANISSSGRRLGWRKKKHSYQWKDSDSRSHAGGSTSRNDTEQQHRRERLIQQINNVLVSDQSSQAQDEVPNLERRKIANEVPTGRVSSFEKNPRHRVPASHNFRQRGSSRNKGKQQLTIFDEGDVVLKSKGKRESREGNLYASFPGSVSWKNQVQRNPVQNGYTAPYNSATSRISSEADHQAINSYADEGTFPSFSRTSNKNKVPNVTYPYASLTKTEKVLPRRSQLDNFPKYTGQGRLMRNGSPSDYDTVHYRDSPNDCSVETAVHGKLLDPNSTEQPSVSPCSEGSHLVKKKGKTKLGNDHLHHRQGFEATHWDRSWSTVGRGSPFTVQDDNSFRNPEEIGWRRYNHADTASELPSKDKIFASDGEQDIVLRSSDLRLEYGDYFNRVNDSPKVSTSLELNADAKVTRVPEIEREELWGKFMNERMECDLICSCFGGSSSSTSQNAKTSCIQSPRHIPFSSTSGNGDSTEHHDIHCPVIELDELSDVKAIPNSPQEHGKAVPDQFIAGISQIEADEILARQLQEQFNDEVAGSSSTEEIYAIEWSLQEENAQLPASTTSRGLFDHEREMTRADLYEYYAQLPYQRSSVDRAGTQRSRRRSHYDSDFDFDVMMTGGARNFSRMDVAARRNFLEALETAFDQSNNTLETHHHFDENDYETLLALDENNVQQTGASEGQISSLPQSVIQNDVVEEACAICLEEPSRGDIIRHLPCLHKFHRECIDTWLRRKIWCPVCKFEVT